jgi:hypothetical protein
MKKWITPIIVLCVLFGFSVREYGISQNQVPLILVEENVALFHTPEKQIFGMGRLDSPRAKSLSREILPFFASEKIFNIWDIPIGNERKNSTFSIQRISENLVRSVCMEQPIWWIGKDFSEKEQLDAVKAGVNFDSAWWIMMQNSVPDFLPMPKQGIIFAGERTPSKKTFSFSKENKIPLISVKKTNGFMLSFTAEKDWKLKIRN